MSFGDFLRKRLARIYPTHLLTFLVMLASWRIASQTGISVHSDVTNDTWSALCNLLLVHAWGFTKDPELEWALVVGQRRVVRLPRAVSVMCAA